jgi:ribonucleoside-diphosphate reductase alpha chain
MSSARPAHRGATTEFLDPRAVETWDCSFRWRKDGALRDVTIEDTWARVARALTQNPLRETAYRDAFARWRLLPDARLLRDAGTDRAPNLHGRIDAVLNAAAFASRRNFDHAGFAAAATLAKSLVDDARVFVPAGAVQPTATIGLIGFDEARHALGIACGSHESHEFALRLAASMVAHAGRQSVGLTPQPLLARLANHVSDGFDGPDRDSLLAAVEPWLPQRA